jgi:ubiquinone/menaquinone biosynthesis C-methylase UbiE
MEIIFVSFVKYFDLAANFYQKLSVLFPIKKLEMKVILSFISFSKDEKILDVGCGPGIYLKEIEDKVSASIGLDNSEKMIKQAKRICHKSYFIIDDAERFNLNIKFDKVLCLGVLEFCKNPKAILQSFVFKGQFFWLFL